MSIFTEKNKNAPSQEAVTCVFDKRNGLHKFWSEYTFLSELTPSEKKYYKDENKLLYPLSIKKAGAYAYLEFIDPTTGTSQYTSDKFYKREALNLYNSSEQFRQAFDYVVSISVDYRIKQGLFQLKNTITDINSTVSTEMVVEDSALTEEFEEEIIEEGTYQSVF